MKVAICLSGHMRMFEKTVSSLSNIKINNDCDIFIHTWDKMGYSSAYKTDRVHDSTNKYLARINSVYKPKKIIIEDSLFIEELKRQGDQYAPHLIGVPKHVGHMASMFYKIYAANELRKQYELQTGTKYDWVVRCRTDLLFHNMITYPTEESKVHLTKHLSGHNWLCDQFAIGKPDVMDLYSSFFFNIPDYFRAKKEYYPEIFMNHCMNDKKLSFDFGDYHFSLLR